MIYTDVTLKPIYDNQPYTSTTTGTKYPSNYPKDEITDLHRVVETEPPTDALLVVTGFTINSQFTQVWESRSKTGEELSEEIKNAALVLLSGSDMVALRCVKAGVSFPTDWQTYVTTLRGIVASGEGEIPAQPDYPEGT